MILDRETAELIAKINDKEIYNSIYLGSQIVPSFIIGDNNIIAKTIDKEVQIDNITECFLRTLCQFTFSPLWYFKNILEEGNCYSDEQIIKDLLSINMIFIDNTTNGAFLRPTKNLYRLFSIPMKKSGVIPYNMLTHEMSKFDIYYKVLRGCCDEINRYLLSKHISNLVFKPPTITKQESDEYAVLDLIDGNEFNKKTFIPSLIIDEENIKIDKNNTDKISNVENRIIDDLRQGERISCELKDYTMLFLENVQCKSDEIMIKFPDLVIPIMRSSDLSPNTIGVEMELTCKAQEHYDKAILTSKNNLKYGAIIWFVNDFRTKAKINQAIKNVGDSGTCKNIVVDYTVPMEYLWR